MSKSGMENKCEADYIRVHKTVIFRSVNLLEAGVKRRQKDFIRSVLIPLVEVSTDIIAFPRTESDMKIWPGFNTATKKYRGRFHLSKAQMGSDQIMPFWLNEDEDFDRGTVLLEFSRQNDESQVSELLTECFDPAPLSNPVSAIGGPAMRYAKKKLSTDCFYVAIWSPGVDNPLVIGDSDWLIARFEYFKKNCNSYLQR